MAVAPSTVTEFSGVPAGIYVLKPRFTSAVVGPAKSSRIGLAGPLDRDHLLTLEEPDLDRGVVGRPGRDGECADGDRDDEQREHVNTRPVPSGRTRSGGILPRGPHAGDGMSTAANEP